MTQVLERLAYVLRAETEGLANDLKGAESHFGKFTKFVERNPLAAAGALGAALTGVGVKATQMALEVERSLHRIERVVPGAVGKLGQLREAIEQASRSSPRTQAEFAQAADAIARGGVESIEGLQQRLVAGARAADASGGDLIGILGGLDQALDLFGASSAEAEGMLAKLFATAKGRVPMEDLFAALQAAAPLVRDLDLDFDTAARALGALLEEGKTAKQAASALKGYAEFGREGAIEIRRLAESHTIAATAAADYERAVKAARETTEGAWQITKNNFSAVMIDLGQTILPWVTKQLNDIVNLLDKFNGSVARIPVDGRLEALRIGISPRARGATAGSLRSTAQQLNRDARAGLLDLSRQSSADLERMQATLARIRTVTGAAADEFFSLSVQIENARKAAVKLEQARAAGGAGGSPRRARTPEQIKADREAAAQAAEALAAAMAEHEREMERVRADRLHDAAADQVVLEEWAKGYQRLKERVEELKQAEAELADVMERKQLANLKEDLAEVKAKQHDAFANLVESLGPAVSGALALAGAFGEIDQTTQQVANNIVAIATNITKALGGDVGSILAVAGNVIQLAQTGFRGGKSEAEKAQARENAASARAVDRLVQSLGDLVGASISGRQFGRIQSATDDLVDRFLTNRPGRVRRNAAGNADEFYESLGIPFNEVKQLAASLGVTLNGTAESYREFQRALMDADFAAYIDSFVGQMQLLNDSFTVYDITDPTVKFQKLLEALMDPETGAPAIFAALAGVNLSTTEGREQAKQILQGIFATGAKGGFSGELGGLSPDQLIDAVMQLLGFLNAGGTGASAAAGGNLGIVSGFRGLTEAAGNRMADYLRALVDIGRQELDAILALTSPVLLPPSLATASPNGGGSVTVSVQVTQNFHGASDPVSVGRAAADGVRAGVEEALTFTGVVRARRAAGNLKAVT